MGIHKQTMITVINAVLHKTLLFCFGSSACTHPVPVDVSQEQDPALWRTRFWKRGWCDRGFRDLWQSDIPRSIDVKFATGRAHQQGARFRGPQQGPLQSLNEVVPEQFGDFPTHPLLGQVESDTCFTDCIRHSLFIGFTLEWGFF